MNHKSRVILAILVLATTIFAEAKVSEKNGLEAAKEAYEASDYAKAIKILQAAAKQEPQNGDIYLLLSKSYMEMQQYDAAINAGERAVAIDPRSSIYHEILGRAYGTKAEHAGWLSGVSLAKKTRKEFETAVELDQRNFSAQQALVEFDCSAPGMVGGGEERAKPRIEQIAAMDAAEGHYAAGNCRRQKKDFAEADAEFTKALESNPKSAELVYDIGDYAVKRNQPERLLAVANAGEKIKPSDPRGKYYRAVALVLLKEKPEDAERLLREYANTAPARSGYPQPAMAHVWLGKLFENRNDRSAAIQEYQTAIKLDPKNKNAHEALKRLTKE